MSDIPEAVRRFVLTSIPSVSHLEAALQLRRCGDRGCTAVEISQHLYLPRSTADELLRMLQSAGLVRPTGEGRYCYDPRDEARGRVMDDLAACYATDLIGITNLIHDATQKSAQRFADAFKLRKDK